MEGQRRRHHRGNQEGSSQQAESKTATRDPGGGGYPFYMFVMLCLFVVFSWWLFVSWSSYLTLTIHPHQIQAPEHSHNLRGMLLWGKGALDSHGIHGGREPLWVAALRLGHWMECTTQVWQDTIHTIFICWVINLISYWWEHRKKDNQKEGREGTPTMN